MCLRRCFVKYLIRKPLKEGEKLTLKYMCNRRQRQQLMGLNAREGPYLPFKFFLKRLGEIPLGISQNTILCRVFSKCHFFYGSSSSFFSSSPPNFFQGVSPSGHAFSRLGLAFFTFFDCTIALIKP